MTKLANKIAVVTGASKGIGAAIARQFAAEGATVVVNYATSRGDADKVVADIVDAGGKAVAIGANVSVEAEVRKLFAAVKELFGRVDLLVNNAGVYSFEALDAITPDNFRKMFDTNVLGTLLASREAVALMPASGGAIVNIGTVATALAPPAAAVYAGSKGAVGVVTKSLAKELGPRGIRVNAISPGLTLTEGVHTAGIANSDFERQMIAMTPLGRAAQPVDIALPAVFLASDDARFITGELLFVGGGAGM
ncbi:SDR family NAD(P)-dependent oxidoreductase [Scleromatobacter humisilvae]|uniref:Glucose 1-dehydrogenase n=1 Tax=Scleromatobacter humisilvae TaxID=2897159 RepID=A0A9X1YJV3_9BURK|nr:glucose 1-dehydrogenase [Scleromatobacter humisilvae]MCK9686215.1 glucose 1-dehydrogenase [Scleromatobacter humisilvae]